VFNRLARVTFDRDAREALPQILAEDNIRSILLLTSPSLLNSRYVQALRGAMPSGTTIYGACRPHSPSSCVLEALESLEGRRPDGIVAVGGGSVIDTAKAVAIALWHDITSPDRLTELFARPSRLNSAEAEPRPRIIAIPTTLSVAELSPIGGMLIEARSTKEIVGHQYAIPRSIIYDPSALLGTPRATLLSSGIKALDHAVEALCAIEANHFAAPLAERAVQLLGGTLPLIASAYDSGEMPLHSALAEAQLACWMSATGPAHGVSVGASHAIGHALGAVCGVPHGLTSCVTLAPVLRWNQNYSAGPQLRIAEALTGRSDQQAGTAVEDLVRRLGLPTRLQEIGVTPNQLTEVAAASFADRCTATNCRPISSVEDISEILLTVI
jgi:maleylacetate reductase